MQRIIDIDHVDQALEIQKVLLKEYGIEASIREIQKKYYRFCDPYENEVWFDIHRVCEWEPDKTYLQAFCEELDRNLDED